MRGKRRPGFGRRFFPEVVRCLQFAFLSRTGSRGGRHSRELKDVQMQTLATSLPYTTRNPSHLFLGQFGTAEQPARNYDSTNRKREPRNAGFTHTHTFTRDKPLPMGVGSRSSGARSWGAGEAPGSSNTEPCGRPHLCRKAHSDKLSAASSFQNRLVPK